LNRSWSATVEEIEENGFNLTPSSYKPGESSSKGIQDADANVALDDIRSNLAAVTPLLDDLRVESSTILATRVPLGKILKEVSRPVVVKPDCHYKLLGVRWYGKGVFIKEEKKGSEIKAKKLYRVKSGDLIYSRLFAWKGSFDLVGEEFDDCYVSGEFPIFTVDRKQSDVEAEFIKYYFQVPSSWKQAEQLSFGTSKVSRNRLKQDDFLKIEIPIPKQEERIGILDLMRTTERISNKLDESSLAARSLKEGVVARVFERLKDTIGRTDD
jgi:hypothetical protein